MAPPSLLRMWADSWHSTAPHGGHSADNPSALAAVPLTTGNTVTSGCSKTSATRSRSRADHSSAPYASADPSSAAATAARISGATPAALSLRSSIGRSTPRV